MTAREELHQDATRASDASDLGRSYGYREIDPANKQQMVNSVFDRVASRYDLMNDLMSGGLHRLWKDALVARLAPPRGNVADWRAVDVAGGTGDIALRIAEASRGNAHVCVVDINPAMLEVGKRRSENSAYADRLEFVEGNAEALQFGDATFHAYTIAFGIRNVPDLSKALHEAFRVLQFGGQFLCLEFSAVEVAGLDRLYDLWSMGAIPSIGKAVTGDAEPYRYLVESVRRFPDQHRFADLISDAGFDRVGYRNLSGGIAALHWGWKL